MSQNIAIPKGAIWYGWHDTRKPEDAIRSAAERFREKYGALPQMCLAHQGLSLQAVPVGEHVIAVVPSRQPPTIYLLGPIPGGGEEQR